MQRTNYRRQQNSKKQTKEVKPKQAVVKPVSKKMAFWTVVILMAFIGLQVDSQQLTNYATFGLGLVILSNVI